jgi:stearoyl-CoA desaturase (Delta-9 desaturase)
MDLIPFFLMYFLTGLAITAGYHRYYAHRAYDCHPVVQFLFLLFGAAALQNSAYCWVSDHRYHHRNVDQEGDPYNIRKGFLWAHIGWIFFDDLPGTRVYENIRDLKSSKLVLWQKQYYVPLATIVGLGIPFLIGLAYDRPWGGMLWGGLIRLVFVHHCTFLINSAAHWFGTRPYSTKNTARDSWWLAFFSYGEGYHNFHHAFPSDFRNGLEWYQWDPTKWLISGFHRLGLATRLKKTPDHVIARAKSRTLLEDSSEMNLGHDEDAALATAITMSSH